MFANIPNHAFLSTVFPSNNAIHFFFVSSSTNFFSYVFGFCPWNFCVCVFAFHQNWKFCFSLSLSFLLCSFGHRFFPFLCSHFLILSDLSSESRFLDISNRSIHYTLNILHKEVHFVLVWAFWEPKYCIELFIHFKRIKTWECKSLLYAGSRGLCHYFPMNAIFWSQESLCRLICEFKMIGGTVRNVRPLGKKMRFVMHTRLMMI